MSRRAAVLIGVVLVLAGCGGSDGDDGKGAPAAGGGPDAGGKGATGVDASPRAAGQTDRQRVQTTLDKVFKTNHNDPSNCERVYTERYVNDSFGKEDPLNECKKQQVELYDEDDRADAVKILKLDVKGDEAEAEIAVRGGFSGGNKFDVKLVREGDVFKLDDLEPK